MPWAQTVPTLELNSPRERRSPPHEQAYDLMRRPLLPLGEPLRGDRHGTAVPRRVRVGFLVPRYFRARVVRRAPAAGTGAIAEILEKDHGYYPKASAERFGDRLLNYDHAPVHSRNDCWGSSTRATSPTRSSSSTMRPGDESVEFGAAAGGSVSRAVSHLVQNDTNSGSASPSASGSRGIQPGERRLDLDRGIGRCLSSRVPGTAWCRNSIRSRMSCSPTASPDGHRARRRDTARELSLLHRRHLRHALAKGIQRSGGS